MDRQTVQYITIACGDGHSFGITPDGRYVYSGMVGMTSMTELYDIGRELYMKLTDPVNEDDVREMLQDMYAECECIAFQPSTVEPLPVCITNMHTIEDYMDYIRFLTENRVIGGRLEAGGVILTTDDDREIFFELKDIR